MTNITTPQSALPAGGDRGYAIASASVADDGAKILALWRGGLSHGGMPEAKFDWFYRRGPEGLPDVFFLLHGSQHEAVGVAAIGRRRMQFGTETLITGEMVDFVVQPEHRTLFPAMMLQRAMNRHAQELQTHAILYGLPNPKSLPVFSRVGYRCVGQMVRRVRVLRLEEYLSRHLPGWISSAVGAIVDRARLGAVALRRLVKGGFRSQWLARPDARFDELWRRRAAPDVLIGVRDAAFLTWRFADCPLRSYKFFALFSTRDERLAAYAVCETRERVLHVRDFLVEPESPGAWARLWLDLSLETFRQGYKSLSLEFLGNERLQRALGDAGMTVRDTRPLYASPAARWEGMMHDRHWYLTCADEDG